jgi:hypothetical protein
MEWLVQHRQSRAAPGAALPASVLLLAAPVLLLGATRLHAQSLGPSLPDAPSALLAVSYDIPQTAPATAQAQTPASGVTQVNLPPCTDLHFVPLPGADASQTATAAHSRPCKEENRLQPIVSSSRVAPLTVTDKGVLAIRDIVDPFNLITIAGASAITVAANSHTVYGPGFAGFGKLTGYSLSEDALGEGIGTFAIPSIVREDPRYHRMPDKPFGRRLLHAVAHTVVSQHDDGRLMPNYATLVGYPLGTELCDLYVPGLRTSLPATGERAAVGLATNPIGDIVAEFLPDIARRIHIRIVFVQQIMNQVANGYPSTQ